MSNVNRAARLIPENRKRTSGRRASFLCAAECAAMPEKKSKKPKKPGASLPNALKAPFKIKGSSPERQFDEKCLERLSELLTHYRIKDNNPNKWFSLSFFLADELGLFRTANPGRKQSWSIEELAKLSDEVNEIKKANSSRKMSTSQAVASLLKKHPEKYPGVDAKTLENRHAEAKRRHARLVNGLVKAEIQRPNPADASPQKPVQKDGQPDDRDIRPTFGLAELGRPKIHPEN
jgi:hypothetical protein